MDKSSSSSGIVPYLPIDNAKLRNEIMSNAKILTYTFGLTILFFIYSSFFTVDQTKQAIVLQFETLRVVNNRTKF